MIVNRYQRQAVPARLIKGIILCLGSLTGVGLIVTKTSPTLVGEIGANMLTLGAIFFGSRAAGLSVKRAVVAAVGMTAVIVMKRLGIWGWPTVGVVMVSAGLISLSN